MLQRRSIFLGIMITATCLFAKVTVDYDHKADFAKYHTYSWIGVNVQDPAWKDITANAIDAQLAAKGWQKVASGGDASVSAMGATKTEQTLETWYTGGYGGGWFHRGWWGPGHCHHDHRPHPRRDAARGHLRLANEARDLARRIDRYLERRS
jgi:hypothetical protein